jgi:cytochrome P450
MAADDTPIRFPFPDSPSPYDPAPELRPLHEGCPVVRATLPDGNSVWLVTGYDEVRQVALDQHFSRTSPVGPGRAAKGHETFTAGSINGMGPPMHAEVRKLLASTFTARRVEALRPRVAELVDELLDDLIAGPRPADLVSAFSLPLPVLVVCEMLGVPAADQDKFHAWSDAIMGNWERGPNEVMAAMTEMYVYFAKLIAVKRVEPAEDLLTALIAARDEDGKLSEDELVTLGCALLIGGHVTTATQINLSLLALLAHPDQMARLREDPGLTLSATEELLRYVRLGGGVPPARVTTADAELGGHRIPAGEVVLPFFHAANRDPAVFPDPDRLDLGRTPCNHMAFGVGLHHCLGAQLARVELQEAYRGLLARLPGLRLAVPPEELTLKPKMSLNTLNTLPIAWDES